VDNTSKDGVLLVKVRSSSVANEELASIGVGSRICHTQHTLVSVGVPNLFICELLSIDRHAASAIAHCGVTTLHHKTLDHSVELVSLIVLALTSVLASAKTSEVFASLRNISKELKNYTFLAVILLALNANRHIKEHLGVFGVKGRQFLEIFINLCCFLFVVNTLREELLHSSLLVGSLSSAVFLYKLKVVSVELVLGSESDSCFHIFESLIKVLYFLVSDRTQEKCFDGFGVNFDCFGAVADGFFVVASFVHHHRHVLQDGFLKLSHLFVFVLYNFEVRKSITIVALSLLKFSSLELGIAVVLKSKSSGNEFRVAHHPAGRTAIINLEQLNCKDKSSVGRNSRRRSHSTVGVLRGNSELSLFSEFHAHNSNIPAFDNLAYSDVNFEGFAIVRTIEDGAVSKTPLVVYKNFLTFLG